MQQKYLGYMFFVGIILIQLAMDHTVEKCESNLGKLLIFLHHALQLFFFFGSMVFGYHKYHLILLVGAISVHKVYKRCPLTKIHNTMCGFHETDPLIALINKIVPNYPNNLNETTIVYYTLIISVFIYNVLHL